MTYYGEGKVDVPCKCGCGQEFNRFKSMKKMFYSRECYIKFNRTNPEQRKKYESNLMKEEKNRIEEHHKEAEKHRQTMFVGGFDDDGMVFANEGLIL